MQPFEPSGAFAPLGCAAFASDRTWPLSEPERMTLWSDPKRVFTTLQSDWVSACGACPDTMEM